MHRIKTRQSRARRLLCFTLGVSTSFVAQANPQGPAVAAGNVSFANPTSTTLDITNSPNAIINWQSFDIGVGETTRFIQQDAASGVLNRVTTPNASEILGNLVSNGRVFLVNPSGIVIGRDGMVDTAGLVLSTLNITNENFLAGRYEFNGGPASGNITNHGYIRTTPGGEIVLLAPRILNAPEAGNPQSGIIESENGELVLAAGYSITITSLDDPDISFDVAAPAGEVVNLGQLIARGGSVDVLAETIRHSGEINADALSVDETGRIVLSATKTIETTAGSVISARGEQLAVAAAAPASPAAAGVTPPPNPVGANGGQVTLKAVTPAADPDAPPAANAATPAPTTISLAGRIDVSGARGGRATVEADAVTVKGTIDASGKAAGGTVHVLGDAVKAEGATLRANAESGSAGDIRFGGELRGAPTLRAAETADVDAASRFEASATTRGDGGEIIVWSNEETKFSGIAAARAGVEAGDGGMVEVSGKEILRFAGSVDVGAPRGKAGTLLLDPRNIFIVEGGATVSVDNPTPFTGDGFGSSFSVLGNGNILVFNQDADVNGLVDAGRITLLSSNGTLIGSVAGNAAGERIGSFGSFTNPAGNRFFQSPRAANGGLIDAGAVILFDVASGQELARVSGRSAGELFGQDVQRFATASDTFVVESQNADVGGLVDAGRVSLISLSTGLQLGEVLGGAAGDQFGATVDYSVASGAYLIRSAVADVGGLTDNGTAVLVNNATGVEIGRTSGLANGDLLGALTPITRASGNFLLRVPTADISGNTDAGSVVLVSGTTGTRIGSLDGNVPGEELGDVVDDFSLGNSRMLVYSFLHDNPGVAALNDTAGAIFMVADTDLGSGNIVLGGTLGTSEGELLGQNGVIFANNGNYWIRSTGFEAVLASPSDQGAVILADGATGNEIGRFNGTSGNEFFGNDIIGNHPNGDLIVRATGHFGGAGIIAQLASVNLGGGVIRRGSVDGVTAGDMNGASVLFRPFGNYVVRAPNFDVSSIIDAGSVFAIDQLTGNTLLRVDGNTNNERLGTTVQTDVFDALGGTLADSFAILSPTRGGNSEGAVFFVNSEAGVLTRQIDGLTGDTLGSFNLQIVPGGHLAIRNPQSDLGGANAGELLFVNAFTNFATSGSLLGISANEQLGNIALDTSTLAGLGTGQFLVYSPLRDVSGETDAGAVVLMQGSGAVNLQGAFSGLQLNDQLGSGGSSSVQLLNSGHLVLFNAAADDPTGAVGVQNNEGAVILASTTLFSELGRSYGQTDDNEALGSVGFVTEHPNGNYFIHSPGAGANNEGALYLLDGNNGLIIGRADGSAPNENFGSDLDLFTLNNGDGLVHSQNSSAGGFANSGTVVQTVSDNQLGGGNIVRGRINGGSAGELLGQFTATMSSDNVHYFVRSQLADPGGIANAGSIYFVDQSTATLANRIDGLTANEQLGNGSPFFGSASNLFIRSQQADIGGAVDAGRLIVATPSGGIIGEVTGNTASEFFGSSLQFIGNDLWVTAIAHNNGAGGIFAIANEDLGGGNILRASLLGGAAGDALGFEGFSFIGGNVVVPVPLADIGGLTDAGTVLLVDSGLQLIGRTDGTSANERFGDFSFNTLANGNLVFRSPDADVNGLVDAGTVRFVSSQTGTLVGQTTGTSANERFSLFGFQTLSSGNLVFRSPDADVAGLVDAGTVKLVNPLTGTLLGETAGTSVNEHFGANGITPIGNNGYFVISQSADAGGLADAGAVVQISAETGLEIQRVVGVSANEQFGNFGFQSAGGKFIFGSPLADVGGFADAGRIVIFDPTTTNQGGAATNLLFSNTPDGDFVLTTGAIQNALNGGANLILQANNDIVIEKGAVLTATGGSLTLNAGRSVIVNGLLNMRDTDITILANQNQAGVSLDNRDSGLSEFALFDPQVIGRKVEITADLVSLTGGDAPLDGSAPLAWVPVSSTDFFETALRDGTAYPATFVLGTQSLTVNADTINLNGGTAPGAFAALVSFGDFTVNTGTISLTPGTEPGAHALFLGLGGVGEFAFDSCEGCGNELLFTDPFLSGGAPVSGFFISGILQNPAIDSILAMLDRDEGEDEEEKKKRCN